LVFSKPNSRAGLASAFARTLQWHAERHHRTQSAIQGERRWPASFPSYCEPHHRSHPHRNRPTDSKPSAIPVAAVPSLTSVIPSTPWPSSNSFNRGGVHVNAVGDEFCGHFLEVSNRAKHTGITMAEWPHGVEDVRRVARPPRDSGTACRKVASCERARPQCPRSAPHPDCECNPEARRERQDACLAPRRIKQLAKQFRKKRPQSIAPDARPCASC